MLSLLQKNDDGEVLKPIATLIFSNAGKGRDTNIDSDGIPVYLDTDTTAISRKQMQLSLADATATLAQAKKSTRKRKHVSTSTLSKLVGKMDAKRISQATEIKLREGHAFPLPVVRPNVEGEKKYRECIYVSAPCDSGKSTWIAKYLRLWVAERIKFKQTTKILLFSRVTNDNAFRGLHIKQIKLDDELLKNPIDVIKELSDCMVIFDDIDSIIDKPMREYLWSLRDEVMTVGSHSGTYTINTSHQLINWKSTRSSLKECHLVVMFPYAERAKINDFLEKRVGLERANRVFITSEAARTSRWVALSLRYPNYIIYENGIKLLLPTD